MAAPLVHTGWDRRGTLHPKAEPETLEAEPGTQSSGLGFRV